jgi:RimJ/RimL family protein N-acetyltransferase
MSYFHPGKIVKEFTTKKGHTAQLIYPKWELVDQVMDYINTLSAEDTFVSFSGEEMTLKDEAEFLAHTFVSMELGEAQFLFCIVDGKFAGICGIEQMKELRKRSKHVGSFGLSIAKEFRGEGLGYELAYATIVEATKQMRDLKIVVLSCFSSNVAALALYKKLGFEETGRKPKSLHYKGEYIDEVQMTLSSLPHSSTAAE